MISKSSPVVLEIQRRTRPSRSSRRLLSNEAHAPYHAMISHTKQGAASTLANAKSVAAIRLPRDDSKPQGPTSTFEARSVHHSHRDEPEGQKKPNWANWVNTHGHHQGGARPAAAPNGDAAADDDRVLARPAPGQGSAEGHGAHSEAPPRAPPAPVHLSDAALLWTDTQTSADPRFGGEWCV